MENKVIFTHRGIQFGQTHQGLWIFYNLPDWVNHSSRYFTNEELNNLNADHMAKSIDRMFARTPIYNGDLRYRVHGENE